MKIANADKLKKHFENVVDVKLFTAAEICTIIDSFSIEVPDSDPAGLVPNSDPVGLGPVNLLEPTINFPTDPNELAKEINKQVEMLNKIRPGVSQHLTNPEWFGGAKP